MIGIELVTDQGSREAMPAPGVLAVVDDLLATHRVLVRDYGPTIVLGPPFILTQPEVSRISGALIEVLSRLGRNGDLAAR